MAERRLYMTSLLAAAMGSGSAYATSCAPSLGYRQLAGKDITALLVGSVACFPANAPYTNQEYLSGSNIVDYKKGPNDAADPSTATGTFNVQNGANGTITYSYIDGSSYTYTVWGPTTPGGSAYDLCVERLPITIRIVAGSRGPC